MTITLNGENMDVPDDLMLEGLLRHLNIVPDRVAVEVNEEIVRKTTYAFFPVKHGDRVEIVQFMGGGSQISECKRSIGVLI